MNKNVKLLMEKKFLVDIKQNDTLSDENKKLEAKRFKNICDKHKIPCSNWTGSSRKNTFYGIIKRHNKIVSDCTEKRVKNAYIFKSVDEFENFINNNLLSKEINDFLKFKT